MKTPTTLVSLFLCLTPVAVLIGCRGGQTPPSAASPPVVPVSQPIERKVTDYVDFTGRTDAIDSVGIKPRVTGFLTQVAFKEGGEVKKDELLFEVDPRPYKAQLDQALAQVELNKASLKLAQATYERVRPLVASGAASQQEADEDLAAVEEARARIKASQAAVEVYKLNLEFCRVTSPIDGIASRTFFTVGNLVIQDQTLLTTVVSVDPMYAYFDMDEPTLLSIKRAINEGRIKVPSDRSDISILMGLQGEEGFPHHGKFNFINNVVNPSTGTIAVRGVFANPRPSAGPAYFLAETFGSGASAAAGVPLGALAQQLGALGTMQTSAFAVGTRLLVPGMFARIRLPIGQPHPALLVIDRAVGSDQGLKFVYVLDKDHKVQYRRVTTGPLEDDGLRVIEKGLEKDDWVVVGALQQVRPRMEVQPEEIPMPTLATQGQAPSPVNDKAQPPPPGENKK
jgi:multidrug efflux system membrane fusion protein